MLDFSFSVPLIPHKGDETEAILNCGESDYICNINIAKSH